jgi:mycofactocin system transcriptional regulator
VTARRSGAGRPPATTRADIERAAFDLFDTLGFERATVDDIAAAAGIGRRTFFRYFASKNDVVWGDFDAELQKMRERLAAYAPGIPLADALREAVVEYNRLDPGETERHRRRMSLILNVPALQAHSTLRYAEWRQVVADFVAGRLGLEAATLVPQLVGYTALGAALAAYEQWLGDERADLSVLLDTALRELCAGLAERDGQRAASTRRVGPRESGTAPPRE